MVPARIHSRAVGAIRRGRIAVLVAALGASAAGAVGVVPTDGALSLSLDKLTATRERPLFVPTRRPPPVAEPVVVEAPPPVVAPVAAPIVPPNVLLTGVIISEATQLAIVQLKASGKTVALKPGDDLEGWTIIDIGPRRVTLKNGEEDSSLELKQSDVALAIPEAAPAPVQPPPPPPIVQRQMPPQVVQGQMPPQLFPIRGKQHTINRQKPPLFPRRGPVNDAQ